MNQRDKNLDTLFEDLSPVSNTRDCEEINITDILDTQTDGIKNV